MSPDVSQTDSRRPVKSAARGYPFWSPRFWHGMMLGDDGLLSLAMAQLAVETALSECDRFYPAFQFVLWGDRSPRDALDAAMVEAQGEA